MTETSLQSSTMHVAYDRICDFTEWSELRVDGSKFENLRTRLRSAQESSGGRDLQWAQDRILRATALETGAVEDLYAEGATHSVAMEVDGWKQELASKGDGAEQHFEDQLAAYLAVRGLAKKGGERPLAEIDIRELHGIATLSQSTYPVLTAIGIQYQPFIPGAYKTAPNRVINRAGRVFHYAPVEDVSPEMRLLVETMRSEAYIAAHPVIQSAYVHWAIAHVHPFADGNGRMARVVGSIPLLAEFGVPLVVFAGRKRQYLQALEAADRHAHQEMVDYIESRALDTYSWLAELLEGATAADSADGILTSIDRLLRSGDEPLETSMEAAQRLERAMLEAIEFECSKRFGGTRIKCEVLFVEGYIDSKTLARPYEFDYLYTNLRSEVKITLSADEVDKYQASTSVQFGYTDVPENPPLVIEHDIGSEDVYFSLEDCSPDLSVGADLRIQNLAATVVTDVTRKFNDGLTRFLRSHGRLPSKDA